MHSTCGMGDSVVASSILTQTALFLAQYEAKTRTIIVIYTEFTADQYTYILGVTYSLGGGLSGSEISMGMQAVIFRL